VKKSATDRTIASSTPPVVRTIASSTPPVVRTIASSTPPVVRTIASSTPPVVRTFWDSSGLLLLVLDQRGAKAARAIRRVTGPLVVWWGTEVEVTSALGRLAREGDLTPAEVALARRRLDALLRGATEVGPSDPVRDRAKALVLARPLRAADALQLSAALAWVNDRPSGRLLVSFDARLAEVARQVGFDVRP
jgi:predicted nucleic acid-binding protein